MNFIKNKEFKSTTPDADNEIFVIYIASFISFYLGQKIHLFYRTPIAYFKINNAFISILSKYADFVIFFQKIK